ncbi:MAG: YebC/PmpR family DNA-binding transcriptional regulator [Halobacteriovoraceae bacterium]|jgi:YebC/PmpR family DNA-binding regulatory protein|nr:YebC/PmpR family DNA-binding transcriptional regulator [Halobacteriovoraceae bacterium]
MGRKWNNIKMKKAAQDKLRSQSYTKVLYEVTIAVKDGGEDPDANFALKVALQKAKSNNVPKDNVDKAIKKGLGNDMANWNEITYEGYGVDGVAIFVEAMTDNPTRTIGNVRSYFKRWEGSVGKEGSLQFIFDRKSVFTVKDTGVDPDELLLELIDDGAEEIEKEDEHLTITASVESFGILYKKLESFSFEIIDSGLERVPLLEKAISKDSFEKIQRLIDALEADDDVQKVYHNVEWSEELTD